MQTFTDTIAIIGVNPYVVVPDNILRQLFTESGKEKGPIPVKGTLNGKGYIQTVVKYQGVWRLYLNTPMRNATQTVVGDAVTVSIAYDPAPRIVLLPKLFQTALGNNTKAKAAYEKLPPYRQKEIARYLKSLKSIEALQRNVTKTIHYLEGKAVRGVLYR